MQKRYMILLTWLRLCSNTYRDYWVEERVGWIEYNATIVFCCVYYIQNTQIMVDGVQTKSVPQKSSGPLTFLYFVLLQPLTSVFWWKASTKQYLVIHWKLRDSWFLKFVFSPSKSILCRSMFASSAAASVLTSLAHKKTFANFLCLKSFRL